MECKKDPKLRVCNHTSRQLSKLDPHDLNFGVLSNGKRMNKPTTPNNKSKLRALLDRLSSNK